MIHNFCPLNINHKFYFILLYKIRMNLFLMSIKFKENVDFLSRSLKKTLKSG